jgi:thioredoxin-related protein
MHLSTLVAALALQTPPPAPAPAPPAQPPNAEAHAANAWFADFDPASEAAKNQKKDLLVDFTGSDWCPWCVKLHEEVFGVASFLDAAQKSYVLVSLDFPRSEEALKRVPNPARNRELARKYRIEGYPTVLLMTASGDAYAKMGYEEGGPDKFMESLRAAAESGRKELEEVNAFVAAFEAAPAPERSKQVEAAIARLGALAGDSPFATKVARIVAAGYSLDPGNKSGLERKAFDALLAAHFVDDATVAAAKSLDPKNAEGLIERTVLVAAKGIDSQEALAHWLTLLDDLLAAGPFKDAQLGKRLLGSAAVMANQHLKDLAKAKVYATKLKELGLDGPDDEDLKQWAEEILAMKG